MCYRCSRFSKLPFRCSPIFRTLSSVVIADFTSLPALLPSGQTIFSRILFLTVPPDLPPFPFIEWREFALELPFWLLYQREKLRVSNSGTDDLKTLIQCCGSETIYSGSSFEFSEFRIRIHADPDPTYIN